MGHWKIIFFKYIYFAKVEGCSAPGPIVEILFLIETSFSAKPGYGLFVSRTLHEQQDRLHEASSG